MEELMNITLEKLGKEFLLLLFHYFKFMWIKPISLKERKKFKNEKQKNEEKIKKKANKVKEQIKFEYKKSKTLRRA